MGRFIVTFVLLSFVVYSASGNDTARCFNCICDGRTNCGIEYGFWVDAGRKTPPGVDPHASNAYDACMNYPACTWRTLKHYYNRFNKDCNGDGVVNCYDYARMHIFGGFNCGHSNHLVEKIEKCFR